MNYIERNVMQLSLMEEYHRVFETGQRLVQGGRIDFFVCGSGQVSLDLNNTISKASLKLH